jgi:hypothetical protein
MVVFIGKDVIYWIKLSINEVYIYWPQPNMWWKICFE